MAKDFLTLLPDHMDFIKKQKIFFTATADLQEEKEVNLSPKGYETFLIMDEKTVAYLDYPGSGNATARHVQKGSPLTIMFISFEEKPMILRLYGQGEIIRKEDPQFNELGASFGHRFGPWTRQIIVLNIRKVKTSCGEAVPFFEYKGERETLHKWANNHVKNNTLDKYIQEHP